MILPTYVVAVQGTFVEYRFGEPDGVLGPILSVDHDNETLYLGTTHGVNLIDTANVYYDHPFHAPMDHALAIDFVCEADGARERVAVEISRESALELMEKIKAALASGDDAHGAAAAGERPVLAATQGEVASLF